MITLIIWGTKGVEGVKESGQFFCPSCIGNVPYDHKRIRRFFTLYFIPLIPLGTLQEWVECKQCGGSFETEVLQMQPQLPAGGMPQQGGYPPQQGGYPQQPGGHPPQQGGYPPPGGYPPGGQGGQGGGQQGW